VRHVSGRSGGRYVCRRSPAARRWSVRVVQGVPIGIAGALVAAMLAFVQPVILWIGFDRSAPLGQIWLGGLIWSLFAAFAGAIAGGMASLRQHFVRGIVRGALLGIAAHGLFFYVCFSHESLARSPLIRLIPTFLFAGGIGGSAAIAGLLVGKWRCRGKKATD